MPSYALLTLALAMGSIGLAGRMAELARIGTDHMEQAARAIDAEARIVEARYETAAREVTNWRLETAAALEPGPVAMLAALLEADRPVVTRCVKLNNYWCIKKARWNGELGADEEGHVGFASAGHGADAAATLLRRYYLEFGRKSALEIVRRWAPAECSIVSGSGSPVALAVKGIGSTLRARYLASRRNGKDGKIALSAPGGRISAVVPREVPTFRVPDIAAGIGEKKRTAGSDRVKLRTAERKLAPPARQVAAAEPPATGAIPPPKPQPMVSCAPDEQRIQNYASRIVEGLGLGPKDDLDLFEPDGTPKPNLAPVMLAMSAFELGTLRASSSLVAGAIERATLRAKDSAGPEVEAADQPKDMDR